MSDRWAQYESKYDATAAAIPGLLQLGPTTFPLLGDLTDEKFKDIDETFELLHHDTAKGVIRPRLIVLNAWLKVCEEMRSEGQWGQDLAEELCDDNWCMLILMEAGVSEVEARAWADSEWK